MVELKEQMFAVVLHRKQFELSPESFSFVSAEECRSHKYFQNAN